jgi:hypothetical protein
MRVESIRTFPLILSKFLLATVLMTGGVSLAAIARNPSPLDGVLPAHHLPAIDLDARAASDLRICGGMLVILSLLCLKDGLRHVYGSSLTERS